jgi:5-formyltetrahydrofolate cyclo-ligase
MSSESKSQLRAHFRKTRSQISVGYRAQAANAAATIFAQQEIFRQSEGIACYFSFGNEFDSTPLIEAVWQAKKQCYLPVLTAGNTLRFVLYNKGDALQNNRYSIPEPVNVASELRAEELDIVMTPLVAFDLKGNRLGAGGGYYDRTFAFLQKNPVKRPLFIGLAYASQQAEKLPCDEWDVGLHGVITEKEFIWVTKPE